MLVMNTSAWAWSQLPQTCLSGQARRRVPGMQAAFAVAGEIDHRGDRALPGPEPAGSPDVLNRPRVSSPPRAGPAVKFARMLRS